MASTYSDLLRAELQATGENDGTWGSLLNTVIQLLERAMHGTVAVAGLTGGTYDLTTNNGSDDEARYWRVTLAGTLVSNQIIEVPAKSHDYRIKNNTTGDFKVTVQVNGGGGAGVVIPQGREMRVICDGTDCTLDYEGLPPGTLAPYAGTSAPGGWLLCYGQAVNRVLYASLFAAIGTTFGAGDGSTTFNLPDLRGRAVVGKDDMGGSAASRITAGGSGITGTTLGASGGSQTHTLVTGEMPSHQHSYYSNNVGTLGNNGIPASSSSGIQNQGFATDPTGGGGAHQNTQPSIILNYIVKT